jgi:hypothetical protein
MLIEPGAHANLTLPANRVWTSPAMDATRRLYVALWRRSRVPLRLTVRLSLRARFGMNPAVSAYAPVPLTWFQPDGRRTVETPIAIYLSRQVFMLAAQRGFSGSGKTGVTGVPGAVNRSLDSQLRGNELNGGDRLTQPLALPIVKATSQASPPRDDMGRRLALVPGVVNRSLDSRLHGNDEKGGSRFAQSLTQATGNGQSPEQRHVSAPQRKVPDVLAWRPRPAAPNPGDNPSLGDLLYDQAMKHPVMPGLALRMLREAEARRPCPEALDRAIESGETPRRPASMPPSPVLSRDEVTQVADQVAQMLKQRERFERERQGRF